MRINPESLARASSRHPWRVVIGWVVLIAAAGMTAGALLGGVLNYVITAGASMVDVIDERFAEQSAGASTEFVIISSNQQTVDDAAFKEYVGELQAALAARKDLVAEPPASYYDVFAKSEDAAAGLVSAAITSGTLACLS